MQDITQMKLIVMEVQLKTNQELNKGQDPEKSNQKHFLFQIK